MVSGELASVQVSLTCVVNTSTISFSPAPYRILAHATPFPTYQSPLKKAVGLPFRGYLTMLLSSMGHFDNIASPPPNMPL